MRNRIAAVTAQMAESVAGMAVDAGVQPRAGVPGAFDELNVENRTANIAPSSLFSVFFPSIELLGVIATGACCGSARSCSPTARDPRHADHRHRPAALVFQPLQELSELYGQVQSAAAAMVKIASVLDTERDIAEARRRSRCRASRAASTSTPSPSPTARAGAPRPRRARPAGGCLALVGESGGGKSTLAKLIARFYDPADGAVRVDGHDLREVDLASYRRQLGVVLQDPFLFSGTIADNIRFARPDATDEEVRGGGRAIGVDRVAARLDGGLDHVVREGGAGLSAGERQLISIARALLADPRILILDEATSNIDRPTESLIERALDRLLRGRTSVIIAHRLSTVRRATRSGVDTACHGARHRARADRRRGPFRRLSMP